MADASVLLGLTRIHQPFLVARACADEAPMLTKVARMASAITEPIHCLRVFIVCLRYKLDLNRIALKIFEHLASHSSDWLMLILPFRRFKAWVTCPETIKTANAPN